MVNKETLIVNFLENYKCTLEESEIPNCNHYGANPQFVRSPKIPIVIEGVRVRIILDTGAEVSTVNTKFIQSLFPGNAVLVVIPEHFHPPQPMCRQASD